MRQLNYHSNGIQNKTHIFCKGSRKFKLVFKREFPAFLFDDWKMLGNFIKFVGVSYLLGTVEGGRKNYRSPGHSSFSNSLTNSNYGSIQNFPFDSNPIVRIQDGALRGFTMKTISGRSIDAFNGIPFAQPPIGNLRFRDPVRNLPWNGTRDAIAQSPHCIQMDMLPTIKIHGQEDCLYLNVYRPQKSSMTPTEELLPVIVWVHGGGYFFGAGSLYGPAYLLDHDIILVTFNYRLGPFGFLATGDDASYGNYALKDQHLALIWTQKNIVSFGGNPNSVTLFGESAGSSSIHLHMINPNSQGLFHRGILDSAAGMCEWSIIDSTPKASRRVGDLLNCTGTSHEMVDCLRKLDANTIAPIQLSLYEWDKYPSIFFGPVIEPDHPGAFLTESPEEAYANNRVLPVPWIHGFNKGEMGWFTAALFLNESSIQDINNNWDFVGPRILDLSHNTTEINSQIARQIRHFYMEDKDLTFETRLQFADMFGDRRFVECGLEAMRYHSMFTKAPVYAYQLTYEGRYSILELWNQNPRDWGVVHLDELIYLFNNTDYWTTLQPTDEEFKMSRIMTSMWTNFAIHGRPYLQSGNSLDDIWEPIPQSNNIFSPIRMLELNLIPKMIDDPYVERYNFWRMLDLPD